MLIDWAFVGVGPIGEDAGNLVPDAVFDFHVDPAHIGALFDTISSAYASGPARRRLAGRARELPVRDHRGIAAKYVWIAPAIALARRHGRELLNRRPIDETLRAWLPASTSCSTALTTCSGH